MNGTMQMGFAPSLKKYLIFALVAMIPAFAASVPAAGAAPEAMKGWKCSGTFYILTTPEGADLPETAKESNFPVLLRLDRGTFQFAQAKRHGEDVRFADSSGSPLAYQIEEWDAAKAAASIWLRIPLIAGKSRQAVTMYWGNAEAASESPRPPGWTKPLAR